MELQDQLKSDQSQYLCNRPPVEFDPSANCHNFCSKLKNSSVRLGSNSDPYCNIWTDDEQARVKNDNNHSFAMDARIRLDHLKSGCSSPLPCCGMNGMLYNYEDLWDSEESDEEESALDLVELLDVEDDVQDEENWLYESPKKHVFGERNESALGWCRHVLDNPSPQMGAACRSLINRLDQRLNSHFYRRPAIVQRTGNVSVHSWMDKTFVSTTHNTSESIDNKLNISHEVTTSHRLQDITDVHIMARMQEASLRQDYASTPAAVSWRHHEPELMLPSYFSTSVKNINEFNIGKKMEASSSSCRQPGLSSPSSSPSLPTSASKQGCQSPQLSKLHQQVTQFKLLKLAQNQVTSPHRTRSPLRTSLRSLQAVRNGRSLEADEYQPAESQITLPPSGALPVRRGSSVRSPSNSVPFVNSNGFLNSVRDSLDRTTAVKRLQRSQSVSPCRIHHTAKGYLPVHGRVFASPERSTAVAWARNAPPTQR